MESLSPPSSTFLGWQYFLVCPVLAVAFVLSFISPWWWLALKLKLKLGLVQVPLVQVIFGLQKKPVRPKPPSRRISRYYNSINAHNSVSQ